MLTKKHFEKTAAYIDNLHKMADKERQQHDPTMATILNIAANHCFKMAIDLNDNPNFDEERFRHACGFKP